MGKVAFVTGGTSGIGHAVVRSLQANGWEVIAPTRQELDLSNPDAVNAYADNLQAEIRHIDAFIHVAGIWHNQHEALAGKKLSEFSPEQIAATMHVGLTSVMVLTAKLAANMRSGTVIGISGTFADGAAGWLPYYVSKRALEDFLVGLSQDMPDYKVFGISPADTATPAYQRFYPQYYAEAQPVDAVVRLVGELLGSSSGFKSGDIIELRRGERKVAFHV